MSVLKLEICSLLMAKSKIQKIKFLYFVINVIWQWLNLGTTLIMLLCYVNYASAWLVHVYEFCTTKVTTLYHAPCLTDMLNYKQPSLETTKPPTSFPYSIYFKLMVRVQLWDVHRLGYVRFKKIEGAQQLLTWI